MRLLIFAFDEIQAISLRILDVIIDDRVWNWNAMIDIPICIMQAEIANMLFSATLLCLR